MYQRCLMPAAQDAEVGKLEPRHMALAVKRSLRCRNCEHNLSKADFNPSAIKFRINLSAYYHVPDLRFALAPDNVECLSTPKAEEGGQAEIGGLFNAMTLAATHRLPILTFANVAAQPLLLKGFSPVKVN